MSVNHRKIIESRDWFDRLQRAWSELTRPIRVLLVEDDKNDAWIIKNAVERGRVHVTVAQTGRDAIRLLEDEPFDLCLLDLKLVDIGGPEVLHWAKHCEIKTPFVVLTGMQDGSPLIKAALDAGAECIFPKPLTPENVKMIFGGL